GIGLYQGLEILTQAELEAEYIKLEYAQQAIVYIPITSLHLINRYSAQNSDQVPLSRLGNDQWRKEKRRAQEQIRDVAAELLDIYAKRQAAAHEKINFPMAEYEQFKRQFPFEETPDQQEAIDAVLADLQREQPLDRLICGDVGFGKTEVAMRAAFACVQAHKQVAILVPTTLLAQQHYQNFIDRFADWPVNINVLSRFKSAQQQKEILQQLQQHQVDIVIGTHKLLQDNIHFADLGLLIVDEEHRFGVRHKEKIKQLRAAVNILTMTATPIPRTLNMAMAGIRDLSIIATPPKKRLSIKTFVKEKNTETIKEAILRETLRGGQVFYLHNDVQSIGLCEQQLRDLMPGLRIEVAHGQMREKELENIMNDFYHHRYDVLICTTIIETGIDIPKANTIVVDQANNFGLAQLHQLRGRVGRSHHQAYAYLLVNSVKHMSKDAMQRLEAISTFDQLGAGFLLANQDLEIRGAGDFLGENQSGHMAKIGFSLYMDMLEAAVEALKQGREPDEDPFMQQQTEVDLGIPALFPETYIRDTQLRLSLYKRIANCHSSADLDELQVEVIDRFGLLPVATQDLFSLSQCKLQATALGIKKLTLRPQYLRIEFNEQNKINPQYIIECLQSQPNRYKMDNGTTLKWFVTAASAAAKMQLLKTLLTEFEANCIRESA
ncbi:MAG: transcription-repair coupling factor, partial [Shewanellaceae bacterium]|nr:transcription-repair coupling factor [Shewanellaceae bacterium]